MITGNPGTGKSHGILACVSELLQQDVNIMIATPTGFLASGYRSQTTDEVTCDTVHSSFTFPILSTETSKINWSLSHFDLIIIDEFSNIYCSPFPSSCFNQFFFFPVTEHSRSHSHMKQHALFQYQIL